MVDAELELELGEGNELYYRVLRCWDNAGLWVVRDVYVYLRGLLSSCCFLLIAARGCGACSWDEMGNIK